MLTPDSPRPEPSTPDRQSDEPPPPIEIPSHEAVLEDEFYGPPPEWLPENEGYLELEAAFHRLQEAQRRAELTVPTTVCGGLDLGADAARRITTMADTARRDGATINTLHGSLASLRRDLAASRAEVAQLRGGGGGSSSTADAQRGDVAALTKERDDALASLSSIQSERDAALKSVADVTAERDSRQVSLETVTTERDTARSNLQASQATLTRVRGELSAARTNSTSVQTVQTELDGVRAELTSAEEDLASVRADLAAARTARAAADRRATRILSAVQSQLGTLVTDLGTQVQEAADAVGAEARNAANDEGSSSNANKRRRT